MKFAIVGSQAKYWLDYEIGPVKLVIATAFVFRSPTLFISGGAPGVDTWAEQIADARGVRKLIFRPINDRWEPEGFKARNIQIAEECDELFCIRSRDADTYGSGWTADYAEKIGKKVWRLEL